MSDETRVDLWFGGAVLVEGFADGTAGVTLETYKSATDTELEARLGVALDHGEAVAIRDAFIKAVPFPKGSGGWATRG